MWSLIPRYLFPAGLVVVVAVIAVRVHFGGIGWGDDWALYFRQAKGLATGAVDEVMRQTRFTVDNSGWHSFSPYSYPWGWPLLMAPVYRLFGMNYPVLKFLEVVALCVFLVTFYAIVRRRTPVYAAIVVTLLVALSPVFVGFTDTLLSDLPYLCFVGLSLWWMDRCRLKGMLEASWAALAGLGLLVAFAFNIRREGLTLLGALVGLHVAVLGGVALRARALKALKEVDWKRVAAPYAALAAAIGAFQLLLPGAFLADQPGTGWQNASKHFTYYQDAISEQIGLKDPGAAAELFHSQGAAKRALLFFGLFAVIGLAGRLLLHFKEDVALAAYLLGVSFVMLISPHQEPRYLLTITPLMAYFAYQALPTLTRLSGWKSRPVVWVAAIAPAVALGGLAWNNWADLNHALEYHRAYHYIANGPEEPETKEMFAKFRELAAPDDVALFAQARAFSLYTDRVAIQGSDLDLLLPRSNWYVMAKNSNYVQTELTDAQGAARGLTKVWDNAKYVIWRVPPKPGP